MSRGRREKTSRGIRTKDGKREGQIMRLIMTIPIALQAHRWINTQPWPFEIEAARTRKRNLLGRAHRKKNKKRNAGHLVTLVKSRRSATSEFLSLRLIRTPSRLPGFQLMRLSGLWFIWNLPVSDSYFFLLPSNRLSYSINLA